jgi:hypothetical protein
MDALPFRGVNIQIPAIVRKYFLTFSVQSMQNTLEYFFMQIKCNTEGCDLFGENSHDFRMDVVTYY